jgi:hypothetical protein
MSDVVFSVVADELESNAERMERAALAVRDLRGHPGVLRGRAADCGDDELAAALVGFAGAWDEGLADVAAQATRWQVLLRATVGGYLAAERALLTSDTFDLVAR